MQQNTSKFFAWAKELVPFMNTTKLKLARKLWCVEGIPSHVQRHNIRAWVRSVRHLGGNWISLRRVERLTNPST